MRQHEGFILLFKILYYQISCLQEKEIKAVITYYPMIFQIMLILKQCRFYLCSFLIPFI